MELKFKNMTEVPQQIMKVDGSGISVVPGGEVNLNSSELFNEEIARLKNFFAVETISYKRPQKIAEKKIDGGTE